MARFSRTREDSQVEWWSSVPNENGEALRLAAIRHIVSRYAANMPDTVTFSSSRTQEFMRPEVELLSSDAGQQAAWWLHVYGAAYCAEVVSDFALLSFSESMNWHIQRNAAYTLMRMPVEERIVLDDNNGVYSSGNLRYGFSDFMNDDEHPGTDEQRHTAMFWLDVLGQDNRRFITNTPHDMESVAENEGCNGNSLNYDTVPCYQRGAVEVVANGHSLETVRVCEDHARIYCVPVLDDTRLWMRNLCIRSAVVPRPQRDPDAEYDSDDDLYVYISPLSALDVSQHTRCSGCGAWHNCAPTDLETCYECHRSLVPSPVSGSHTTPPPNVILYAEDEAPGIEHFGIELEVEYANCVRPIHTLTSINDPGVFVLKRDGSLSNGFELVTAPASYAWWMETAATWNERLDTLRKAGMRSYTPETCGMHIHVDRRVFTPSSLLRLMELVYRNDELFIAIAQRKNRMNYCRFDSRDASDQKIRIAKSRSAMMNPKTTKAKNALRNSLVGSFDRYVAINIPTNKPTVEFRMFRGTLNVASFWKNLECAKSLVDFVNTHGLPDMTAAKYTEYVIQNEGRFRHLAAFLRKNKLVGEVEIPKKKRRGVEPLRVSKLRPAITEGDFLTESC